VQVQVLFPALLQHKDLRQLTVGPFLYALPGRSVPGGSKFPLNYFHALGDADAVNDRCAGANAAVPAGFSGSLVAERFIGNVRRNQGGIMTDETYEQAIIELFSSGLATQEQWKEMAAAMKLVSDDLILRDLVREIDAMVRTDKKYSAT
jgi:hypothetical protein